MNITSTLICSLILLTFVSCGSQLRKDHGAIAFSSNFYSAEFRACGEIQHGMAVCSLKEGSDYNQVNLQIQGYNYGTIKVSSDGCELSQETFRYSENGLMDIKILGKATKSCLIQFVVQPEYSEQQTQDLVLEDFKGAIYLRSTKLSWSALEKGSRVKQNLSDKWTIPFTDGPDVRVVFFSDRCNVNYDKTIKLTNNKIQLTLGELSTELTKDLKTCVLIGALIGKNKVIRLTWLLSVYDQNYNRLPIPNIKLSKNKITVESDANTSVVSVNDKYKIDRKGKFKFNTVKQNIVRVITVNGRSRIGIWDPKGQKFLWK